MNKNINKQTINSDTASHLGLTQNEYEKILNILDRKPNFTELSIFSAMWSEHCSYKSSKKWLKKLDYTNSKVICGPGENAGVIDIGDGFAAVFKMESHNHPSFIEPYQGAATGVGGILRDIFTMGARPIANFNCLRFGSPQNFKTRYLVTGVVAGIGDYGNCVGIPTVGGETSFHESFDGNILVNAMTVGIAKSDKIFYAKAAGVGNPIVYVGSKTGRDGIHGATMSSSEFAENSDNQRPTVQVGDPFTEKILLEACLELMEKNAIVAIQDMGAAGLTSSLFEMASKGGLGAEIDLDLVPQREKNMQAFELMLSESQERMLIVLKAGKEEQAREIFDKWELPFSVIGKLTNSSNLLLNKGKNIEADLPIAPLVLEAPKYNREWSKPKKQDEVYYKDFNPKNLKEILFQILGSPDICSKKWIGQQYDNMIMNDTIVGPGSDAAVIRIHGTQKALAITTDCTPRYVNNDPKTGAAQAVIETWRNLTAVGALPIAITDCLNFGNPEKPEIMGQFVESIKGIKEACSELDFPVVSGNVSFYNETNGKSIQPTPQIGGVGIIDNLSKISKISWDRDDLIIVIGKNTGHLNASSFAKYIHGNESGPPPPINFRRELLIGNFIRNQIINNNISSCHDISEGGLLVALSEMALASKTGAILTTTGNNYSKFWFSEDQARYVVSIKNKKFNKFQQSAKNLSIPIKTIGKASGDSLIIDGKYFITLDELKVCHENWMPKYMSFKNEDG